MQQNSQTKNTILFVVLMGLCLAVWAALKYWVFPPPPAPPPPPASAPADVNLAAAVFDPGDGGLAQGLSQVALLAQAVPQAAEAKPAPPPVVAQAPPRPPTPLAKLKATPGGALGQEDRSSKFHLYAVLDPHGAAVRLLILNKFQQADYLGRPVPESGPPAPLTLIPDDPDNPSFLLLHYAVNNKEDDKPLDTLGRVDWDMAVPGPETLPDGRVRQSVVFTSPPLKELQGFQVTKTFSLTEGDYHLGLEVKVKRLAMAALDDRPLTFRYQMTGAHGLPIEGRWYTNYFRSALIGRVQANNPNYYSRDVAREYQDMRQMSGWDGGNQVDSQPGYLIRYAGVAVQYFASVIVVDNKQNEGQKEDFLARARPTLEKAVVKGVVKSVFLSADANTLSTFTLNRTDNSQDMTFRVRKEDEAACMERLQRDASVAVLYTTGSFDGKEYPEYARAVLDASETQPLWEDDATVRVSTEPAEFAKARDEVVHKYLLYNGPVKVMLLGQPDAPTEAVAPDLVNRYLYDLNLNSMTDYPSNSWYWLTHYTGISYILISITNIMHWVLWFLHAYVYIPYILCIVCLTVMVRGVMFPFSRKQQMTSIRMQQLGPEMKKLQEKFKDDKQALAAAQMELYRRHGVNPFGTCWMLLAQMPIFMGLYYSLQESIHFRLAGVLSPWWLPNLAAPDMLLWWSEYIPFISQPAWYGWVFYLGPYLNVLPIAAVLLMLVQQKWTMPPAMDEQQEQQQKMMKYMMVFMGLMFYKVASGLCIYFIASSLWGFAERKLIPRKKPGEVPPPSAEDKSQGGILARLLGPKPGNGSATTTGPSGGPSGKRGKRRQEAGKPRGKGDGDGSMFQRLRDWWEDILEQARKK